MAVDVGQSRNSVTEGSLESFLSDPGTTPPEQLVAGIFPERSITVLTAQPGSGKSILAMDLFLKVAGGESFAGLKTKQAPVLFIGEDSAKWDYAGIARKLLGATPVPPVFFAWIKTGFSLDSKSACARLIEDARAAGVRGIALDSFRFVHGKDENRSDEMQSVMDTVRGISEGTGAGVLLIHHPTKLGPQGGGSAFRGSSVILASCDFHLDLTSSYNPVGSSRTLSLSCEKGRSADTPDKLALTLAWGSDWASIESFDVGQKVVAILGDASEARLEGIAATLAAGAGIKLSKAKRLAADSLKQLEQTGVVLKGGDRRNGYLYSLRPSRN